MTDCDHILVRLEPHLEARSKAVATSPLSPGALIVSVPAYCSVLLFNEKGRRCDYCHRLGSDQVKLRKCTGCASYWYCGTECQTRQWSEHHRKICPAYPRYTASAGYQTLPEHVKLDAILLSQLVARVYGPDDDLLPSVREDGSAFLTFQELLVGPSPMRNAPPLCRKSTVPEHLQRAADDLYGRFGNNNFVLHSHLNSYGHGIFPLASRLFNHSCVPNAVAKFAITPCRPVRMEVVALRRIEEGEEITIPYLDPALPLAARREALLRNYGFTCTCPLCSLADRVTPTAPPALGTETLAMLEAKLCSFTLDSPGSDCPNDDGNFRGIPGDLVSLVHESYLPSISELFSERAHGGAHESALPVGRTLLAFYLMIYPPRYPQIGMHALELAKVAWNAFVVGGDAVNTATLKKNMQFYIGIASEVLNNFGPEGDEGGPLDEIRLLQKLSGSGSL